MKEKAGTAIRGIVFDKDGTLIDFDKSWEPVIRQSAYMAAGGDLRLCEHLLKLGGMDPETGKTAADSLFAAASTEEIAQAMIAGGSAFDVAGLTAAFDRLFAESAAMAVALTDLPTLLGELREMGLKIGIASSDNEFSIRRTMEALGTERMIDFIAGYDSGHGVKPGAGMVAAFCRCTGLAPGQVAIVGDNRHDLEMGRAANAGLVVGVLSGTGTRKSLGNLADHIIDSIEYLPSLLSGLRTG